MKKLSAHILASTLTTILLNCIGASALAGVVNGYVIVQNNNHFLVDESSPNTYEMTASNQSVQAVLDKLNTFDRIRGQANPTSDNTLILETIDFVMLRKILGPWYDSSSKTTVNFKDYKSLEMNRYGKTSDISYTLSPGSGSTWRIYMSDSNKVTLGTLKIIENGISFPETHLVIEILNTSTGETLETLKLYRR